MAGIESDQFGWRYYNHALLPTCAPHETPDLQKVHDNTIWMHNNSGGYPLLARWTTDFDCGFETNWWYCIKDTPFDIESLNANRRYKITKGNRYFDVRRIKPQQYAQQLAEIQIDAWEQYPRSYRPNYTLAELTQAMIHWQEKIVFGAFDRGTQLLCGYTLIEEHSSYMMIVQQKTKPSCEKLQINAALVVAVCDYYKDRLNSGFYLCDGERNVLHETAFQDYLEKYFGFRKSYCRLHIVYRKPIGVFVAILKPFSRIIERMRNRSLAGKVSAVLRMDSYKVNY